MGSGERAAVFICASFVTTSVGVVMSIPNFSSLRIERSAESVAEALAPVANRRLGLRAKLLGLLTNIRRRALPYFRLRR